MSGFCRIRHCGDNGRQVPPEALLRDKTLPIVNEDADAEGSFPASGFLTAPLDGYCRSKRLACVGKIRDDQIIAGCDDAAASFDDSFQDEGPFLPHARLPGGIRRLAGRLKRANRRKKDGEFLSLLPHVRRSHRLIAGHFRHSGVAGGMNVPPILRFGGMMLSLPGFPKKGS